MRNGAKLMKSWTSRGRAAGDGWAMELGDARWRDSVRAAMSIYVHGDVDRVEKGIWSLQGPYVTTSVSARSARISVFEAFRLTTALASVYFF